MNARSGLRAIAVAGVAGAVFVGSELLAPGVTPTGSREASFAALRARVEEAERVHGATSSEVADALAAMAQALEASGNDRLAEARALSERVVTLRESLDGPDAPAVAEALEALAFVIWRQADFAGELPRGERALVERALAIRERVAPHDEERIVGDLHLLSEVLRVEGEFGGALLVRERIAPRVERLFPRYSDAMAVHMTCLAKLQKLTGDLTRAVESASRAAAIRERIVPPTDPRLAASLNLLGDFLLDQGDLGGAERAFQRAVSISESQPRPDPAAVGRAVEHLGDVRVKRGSWTSAQDLFERALALRISVYGDKHILVARSLERLGAVKRLAGRRKDARAHLLSAIAIQERASAASRPELATSLRELSLLARSESRFSEALDAALKAEAITREHFQFTAGALSEREALTQARARERGLDLAVACALALDARGALETQQGLRVLDELIRSRALVLDVLAARQRVVAVHPDPRTTALVDELRRARNRVIQLTVEGAKAGLPAAERAAETAERTLAERSLEFREELARQRTGLDEIRAALPRDAALVSFVRYLDETTEAGRTGDARYAAFVLRADEAAPRLFALGTASDIDAAVAVWHERISVDPRLQRTPSPVATYREAANRLWSLLWRPFAADLGDVAEVFVTRDGSIHNVNFATLPVPGGDYLVASGPTISYLGAERDLAPPAPGVLSKRGLLAIGDPEFGDASSSPERPQAAALVSLPAARSEVAEIASRWPESEATIVLTGRDADETTVKRLAPACGVLHLATHAVRFAGPDAGGEANPLRCSGLALAGANRNARSSQPGSHDDGMLMAEEIALLDLHGVGWAVLSACASGRGTIEAGEGMLGLERAFRIAGAKNVIASLWPVEDDATRSWMRELYAARRAGASTAEAVRGAAVALLDRQRRLGGTTHPYAWGSFIAVGDGR